MSESGNQIAVERAIEAWNRGDLPTYLQIYSGNVTLHGYAGLEPGRASVRRYYQKWWRAFPGSQLVINDLITSDEKIACRLTINGTQTGSFQGHPPSGKNISVTGFTILLFSDGKCIERWSVVDSLGLLSQIGALR